MRKLSTWIFLQLKLFLVISARWEGVYGESFTNDDRL